MASQMRMLGTKKLGTAGNTATTLGLKETVYGYKAMRDVGSVDLKVFLKTSTVSLSIESVSFGNDWSRGPSLQNIP